MSPKERSLLLKERWSLIQSGTKQKVIRIKANKIFVNYKLHGQIIDSHFIPQHQQSNKADTNSSINWLGAQPTNYILLVHYFYYFRMHEA